MVRVEIISSEERQRRGQIVTVVPGEKKRKILQGKILKLYFKIYDFFLKKETGTHRSTEYTVFSRKNKFRTEVLSRALLKLIEVFLWHTGNRLPGREKRECATVF